MGTRADFYIGRGVKAEWIGSICWDGYPEGNPCGLKGADGDEELFRVGVETLLSESENGPTRPSEGWPWPWENSQTTDFAYAFADGQVWVSRFGREWVLFSDYDADDETDRGYAEFPDMTDVQNVKLGGPGSGIIIVGGTPT